MAFSFGRGSVPTLGRGSDVRSAHYGGVLRVSGDYRLIVTPNGARYCLQRLSSPRAGWKVVSWALSLLVLIGRFPVGLAFDDLAALPVNPAHVARGWA